MRKILVASAILIIMGGSLAAGDELLPAHREWLELVDPIITKTEREVFLKLESAEERTKFIRLFWKRRDSMPDTTENEFYDEYQARVRFADRHFGHEAHKAGHLTERGRFYLILGRPLERQIYATQSDVHPLELWRYKGDQQYGLPSFFYLIFFQERGIGEYRLYSPEIDGPGKLLTPQVSSSALNRSRAYQQVKNVSSELARASLSYLPGESNPGITTLSSAGIVVGVQNLAEKKFNDAYARQFLYYKDFVETEYSHNYIESHSRIKLFRQTGLTYLHWTLEPSRINFAEHEGNNRAVYQLVLRIEDGEGRTILEKEDEIPLIITPETAERQAGRIFAFQDLVPVIPGRYRLYFLLRNKTGNEFSSFDREFFVSPVGDEPAMSELLIYQGRSAMPDARRDRLRAFTFLGTQYLINSQNTCLPGSEVGVFCQVENLGDPAGLSFRLRIFPSDGERPALEVKRPLTEVLGPDGHSIDCHPLSLTDVPPGYYQARASVEDAEGTMLLETRENLILPAKPLPTIPWVYSRMHRPAPDPDHLALAGAQYLATGRYETAESELRRSLQLRDIPHTRMLLARTLFARKQYRGSLDLVLPLYEQTGERDAGKLVAADHAAMGNWSDAMVILERLMETASETAVLNLAAQGYIELGRPEDARPLLEKSLQIDPDQATIKELIEKIRKK